MYQINAGLLSAKAKINQLTSHGHHAESMIVMVFIVEKTIRRTLIQIVISAGFKSKNAKQIVKKINFSSINDYWMFFDPFEKPLKDVISSLDYNAIKKAAEMRNRVVHGQHVYSNEIYQTKTQELLQIIDRISAAFQLRYGFDGWSKLSVRKKSRLHIDPRITIPTT